MLAAFAMPPTPPCCPPDTPSSEEDVGRRLRGPTPLSTRERGTDSCAAGRPMAPALYNGNATITCKVFCAAMLLYRDALFSAPHRGQHRHHRAALGYGMLEWRWPFVGEIGVPDTTLVVEPIAQLVVASGGGNPSGLPNEDSTAFEFDVTNLFSPNPSPGLDLWVGGPRSNIGLRASALLPTGSVEAPLGQYSAMVPIRHCRRASV